MVQGSGFSAHAGGLELDGDAALALDIHVVQELRLKVPVRHRLRHLLAGSWVRVSGSRDEGLSEVTTYIWHFDMNIT